MISILSTTKAIPVPENVLLEISRHLAKSPKDLIHFGETCKKINQVIRSKVFAYLFYIQREIQQQVKDLSWHQKTMCEQAPKIKQETYRMKFMQACADSINFLSHLSAENQKRLEQEAEKIEKGSFTDLSLILQNLP